MENTVHLFEDGYYVISNRSVATSPLFLDLKDCNLFRSKISKHLSPLCDVLSFAILREEFQLVIKLKSKEEIVEYFLDRYPEDNYDKSTERIIPETSYIFAQAMANLQSGYVKCFNYKNERDGGLMAGRYKRRLIENEVQLDQIIESVNKKEKLHRRALIWQFREKQGFGYGKGTGCWSSEKYYSESGDINDAPGWFRLKSDIFLRGDFKNLPPKRISFQNHKEKVRNFLSFIYMDSKI